MNGKLGLGVIAVVLLVVGLGVHTLAAAPNSPRTFTVVIKEPEARVVDLGPAGPSQGDLRVFNVPLYNEQETKVIGREDGVCTMTDPADDPTEQAQGHITQCVVTFSLPDGEITAQGVNSRSALTELPTSNRHAITGGTGTYQTARGEIPYETQGEKIILTFQLRLAP
jgi:hypothetical protein